MLAVVTQVPHVDVVSRVNREASGLAHQREVVRDGHPSYVEEHVMIRAQAEKIISGVGAAVRRAQWPDVRGLCVWACGALQPDAAHLTSKVI